jgi:hypothetical protein
MAAWSNGARENFEGLVAVQCARWIAACENLCAVEGVHELDEAVAVAHLVDVLNAGTCADAAAQHGFFEHADASFGTPCAFFERLHALLEATQSQVDGNVRRDGFACIDVAGIGRIVSGLRKIGLTFGCSGRCFFLGWLRMGNSS